MPPIARLLSRLALALFLGASRLFGQLTVENDSFTVAQFKGYPSAPITIETTFYDYQSSSAPAAYSASADVAWLTPTVDVGRRVLRLVVDPAVYLKNPAKSLATATLRKGAQTREITVRLYGQRDFYAQRSLTDPARPRIYIQASGAILVHDTDRNRPLAAFHPGAGFVDWCLALDGKQLVSVDGRMRRIDRFDLETLQPAAPLFFPDAIPVETFSEGSWRIAAGRDGLLYLTPGRIPAVLYVLDSATGVLKQTLAPPEAQAARIGSLVAAPDSSRLWALTATANPFEGGFLRLAELTLDSSSGLAGSFRYASNPLPTSGEKLLLSASGRSAYAGYTRLDLSSEAAIAPIEHVSINPLAVSSDDAFLAYSGGLRFGASLSSQNLVSTPNDRTTLGLSNEGRYLLDFSRTGKPTKTDLFKLLGKPLLAQPVFPAKNARVSLPLHLAWATVPGATSYKVYLAAPGASPDSPATYLGETTASEFSDLTALNLNTTYRWRVDAIHATEVLRGPVHTFTTTAVESRPATLAHHTVQGVTHDELELDLVASSPDATWSIASNQTWLVPALASGQGSTRLALRLDAASLPLGTHQAALTLVTASGSATIPVSIEVSPLRIVQLLNRPGTEECHALSQTGEYSRYRSFLLRVDANNGTLLRSRLLASELMVRLERHPATGALYVQNGEAGQLEFFDPHTLKPTRSFAVDRTGSFSYGVLRPPLPGPGDSVLFANELLDLSTGAVQPLANTLAHSALPAASSPQDFQFFVGPGRYPPLRRVAVENDRFVLSASAPPPATPSFVGDLSRFHDQTFVASQDGSTVFATGVVYDANFSQIGTTDDYIQSCSQDGRIAIGRRLVHLRPADASPSTKILPELVGPAAFNDATGHIVLTRADGRLAILDPDELPALVAPAILPVQSTDRTVGFSLDWPQATSLTNGYVYQTRLKGDSAWGGVHSAFLYPGAALPLGVESLQPDTDYEVRFCLFTQSSRESDWSDVIPVRTAIRRPSAVPPYAHNATPLDVDSNEDIALTLSAFTGDQITYRLEGAPEGLEFDSSSLSFHGAVSVPGRYTVRLIAENPGGSATIYVYLLVRNTAPLGATSRYVGRQNSTPDPLDGRWTLTRSGDVFSGAIHTHVGTVSIKGRLTPENSDIYSLYLDRRLQGVPVSLYLQWDRAIDRCTVSLYNEEFGSSTSPESGYASTWRRQGRPYPHAQAYTALLLGHQDEDETDEDAPGVPVPEGLGHLRLVLAPDGAASLTGETALGKKFTHSTFIDDRHGVPLFHAADAGIVCGELVVETPNDQPRLFGALEWLHFTDEGSKTYPAGFILPLLVAGAPLPPTGKNQPALAPLANETGRAEFVLSGGALPIYGKPIAQDLAPTGSGLEAPKAGTAENPHRVSLKLDSATGLVTGSASILNADSKPTRTLSFRGRIIKNPLGDGHDIVGGYFLLRDSSGHTRSGLLHISEPEIEAVSITP